MAAARTSKNSKLFPCITFLMKIFCKTLNAADAIAAMNPTCCGRNMHTQSRHCVNHKLVLTHPVDYTLVLL